MSRHKTRGFGRLRVALLSAVAACTASVAFAGAAQAAPFTTSLTYGWADIGAAFNDAPILDGPDGEAINITGDLTGGNITGGDFPAVSRTFVNAAPGTNATLTLDNDGPITGTFDDDTNAALFNVTLDATVVLTGGLSGSCKYEDMSFAFSTGTSTMRPGVPFSDEPADLNGHGAVDGASTLPASNAQGATNPLTCAGLDNLVTGGADTSIEIWLGHDLFPIPGAPGVLTLTNAELDFGLATDLQPIQPAAPATQGYLVTGAGVGTQHLGVVVAPAAAFAFAPSSGVVAGNPLTVKLESRATAIGSFNADTGSFQLPMDMQAIVASGTNTNAGTPACLVGDADVPDPASNPADATDPIDLDLSSAKSGGFNPKPGVAFDGMGGVGAMTDEWSGNPGVDPLPVGQPRRVDNDPDTAGDQPHPSDVAVCNQLNAIGASLPGGLWVSNGINPFPPTTAPTLPSLTPPATTQAQKKKKKCKKGFKLKKIKKKGKKPKFKCVKKKKKKKKK